MITILLLLLLLLIDSQSELLSIGVRPNRLWKGKSLYIYTHLYSMQINRKCIISIIASALHFYSYFSPYSSSFSSLLIRLIQYMARAGPNWLKQRGVLPAIILTLYITPVIVLATVICSIASLNDL